MGINGFSPQIFCQVKLETILYTLNGSTDFSIEIITIPLLAWNKFHSLPLYVLFNTIYYGCNMLLGAQQYISILPMQNKSNLLMQNKNLMIGNFPRMVASQFSVSLRQHGLAGKSIIFMDKTVNHSATILNNFVSLIY